ncbi:MAG: hypothetical protein ABIG10_02370 [bacterium]
MLKDKKIEEKEETASEKMRQRTIKEGLSEIYQSDDGEIINVKKLNIKPKRKWWFWLFLIIGYAAILALIAMGIWYYFNRATDSEAVKITIESDKKIIAGKEFYYTVKYQNLERVGIENILIRLEYPENFIFLTSSPDPDENNNVWKVKELGSHRGGEIKIKGKIIAPKDKQNIILGEMTYQPENFTSEFKKVASFDNLVVGTGIDIEIVSPASAMVNEEQRIVINYKAENDGYMDNFRLTVQPTEKENVVLLNQKQDSDKVVAVEPWVWQAEGIDKKDQELKIRFKFPDKVAAKQSFELKFEYKYDPNQDQEAEEDLGVSYYLFQTKEIDIEIVKNNLNLNLIINGSDQNNNIDFGQTLNYSINYSNKEDYDIEDVMIMAVLEGDLIDWDSIEGDSGVKKDNTITWTKSELPALAVLSSDSSGTIDFSIKVKTAEQARQNSNYKGDNKIKSYAQFQIMLDQEDEEEHSSNISNVIISQVNSDLQLLEQVRYFNDDNIAVGNGPLPPKVGETTSLRAFWQIDNTMHDLTNIQIVAELPAYVVWEGKEQSTAGNIEYKKESHQVIWEIDHLPITNKPNAEFNISITPSESNRNQIMILLPGTRIIAKDTVTDDEISRANKAKTTRLEDDVMIESDGVVQ